MKTLRHTISVNSWIILCLGLVVGAFVLTPSTGGMPQSEPDPLEESESSENVSTELDYEAIQAGHQQQIERQSFLIEIITFVIEKDESGEDVDTLMPAVHKVFKVLSEHIISPNSP